MKTIVLSLLLAITASAKDITVNPGDSLERARDAAQSGDRIILHGGTYRLDHPLVLGPQNSGVTWMAAQGETPVISGGVPVTGWIADTDGRFKAEVAIDNFRQLWVNGQRAQRARGPVPTGLKKWGKIEASVKNGVNPPGSIVPPGVLPGTLEDIKAAGYTTTDAKLADWKNPADMEFGYYCVWVHSICKVGKITKSPEGAVIEMAQPGFYVSIRKPGVHADWPSYMENALELLHEPGQWYFDRPAHTLYYKPRPGEDMAKAEVIAPKLETLVKVEGTLDQPVHDIRFVGLTFAHATWLRPSTALGHPDFQAGFIQPPDNSYFEPNWRPINNEALKTPANVVVDAGHHIQFEDCAFTALGGAGLDLQNGAQSNTVSRCRFSDISGNGIQVGDVTREDHHPSDPRRIVKNNQVTNNTITRIGVEYTDAVGVFYGYTEGTIVAHNEIFDLPYSGISGGWGWGMSDTYQTPTPCKNNRIEFNHIYNLMRVRNDGGGIYTLGSQPGTIIRGNYIHDAGPGGSGGMYLDEGSAFIEVTSNLVTGVPKSSHFNNHANLLATCKFKDNIFNHFDLSGEPGLDPMQFTLTARIRLYKYPEGGDTRRWIVCKAPNEFANGNISLIVAGKNVGCFLNIGSGQPNCFQAFESADPMPLNQWTEVAMTYDGDTLRVYRDGKAGDVKKIGKARQASTAPWTFGGRSDRFSSFDCGNIATVRLYNRALAPEELRGDKVSNPSGLIHAWNFENLPDEASDKIIAGAGLETRH